MGHMVSWFVFDSRGSRALGVRHGDSWIPGWIFWHWILPPGRIKEESLTMEYIHKPKYIAAIVTAVVAFIITMVFNGLAARGGGGRSLWFLYIWLTYLN